MNQNTISTANAVFNYTTSTTTPTAHITLHRNRLKLFGSNVYLKSESHFEIELWNPKQNRILAKIKINGVSVSGGGIVINPGQRVYLERFLDEDRKFKFSTYLVENTTVVKKAIENNGTVFIEFFDEQLPNTNNWIYGNESITTQPFNYGPTFTTNNMMGGMSTPTFGGSNLNIMSCSMDSFSDNSVKSVYANHVNQPKTRSRSILSKSALETGRIEKGERSDQSLVTAYGSFNSWTCVSYSYKILPESQKPAEIGDVRTYCTLCGRRYRSGENFCPVDGSPKTI